MNKEWNNLALVKECTKKLVIKNGFVLVGLLEPAISKEQAKQYETPEGDLYIPQRLNVHFRQV